MTPQAQPPNGEEQELHVYALPGRQVRIIWLNPGGGIACETVHAQPTAPVNDDDLSDLLARTLADFSGPMMVRDALHQHLFTTLRGRVR